MARTGVQSLVMQQDNLWTDFFRSSGGPICETLQRAAFSRKCCPQRVVCSVLGGDNEFSTGLSRRTLLSAGVGLSVCTGLQLTDAPEGKAIVVSPEWEQVQLPLDAGVVLLDIGFTGTNPNHGTPHLERTRCCTGLNQAEAAATAPALHASRELLKSSFPL